MPQVRKTSADIEKVILKAIRHLGQNSSSADIQRYLTSKQLPNMTDSETIVQLNLDKAVDKGLLKKLANGKYKVNETARRRKSRSKTQEPGIKPKPRSRSRKRSGSRRRRRSSSGRRRKRSSSGRRRKRSSSGRRRKRSSSGRRRKRSSSGRSRKRSTSGRRRSRRRTKTPGEQE